MKKLLPLKLLLVSAVSCSFLVAPSVMAKEIIIEKLTLKAFIAMPYEKRIEACAKLVDSEHIGECATLKMHNDAAANASSKEIAAAVKSCKEQGLGAAEDIARCARGAIENKAAPTHIPVSIDEAITLCTTHVSDSEQQGKCVYGLVGKLK
jgi:hypothetical protein